MTYMVAAYAVIWILTFLFVTSIFLRQRSLRRDLEIMEQLVGSTGDRTHQAVE
jgi:CcmD family protein